MKKLLLLFLGLTVSLNLLSQFVEKGFSDTTLWHMHSGFVWTSGNGNIHNENFDVYKVILGDTIINDTLYQKLYSIDSGFNIGTAVFEGYFKTVNKKVFYGITPDAMKLMYNYNLSVGDTFRFDSYYNGNEETGYLPQVVSVDSVLINNKYRIRIEFEEFQDTGNYCNAHKNVVWVEGFGDYDYGLIFDYGTIMFCACQPLGNSELQCFSENSVKIVGDCALVTGIKPLEVYDKIYLYPNPARDVVRFDFDFKTITFYNLMGVREMEVAGKQNQISVRNFQPGIYFYRVVTKDNELIVGKIVVAR